VKSRVFVTSHEGSKVKVLEICDCKPGTGSGDGAVDEDTWLLCDLGGGSADVSRVFKCFASDDESAALRFSFLGTDSVDNGAIGNVATFGHSVGGDELDGVGSSGHSSPDSVGKMSQFIGVGCNPGGAIGSLDEMAVFLRVAGECINDGVGVLL
jgi:hypothetical protein